MTEERNALAQLFAACWKDEALKARFLSDPKAVLAEYGIDVPANLNVNVVENSSNTVHITMPMSPSGATELSDEELAGAAGGCASYIGFLCAAGYTADGRMDPLSSSKPSLC